MSPLVPLGRPTTRRLIALVAASAVACSAVHTRGGRPGLHLALGGISVGACRNDSGEPWCGPEGNPVAWLYQAGCWRSGRDGDLVLGVESQAGRVVLRSRSGYVVAW